MALLEDYRAHTAKRAELGVPPLALTADQTAQLVELLKASPIVDSAYAMELFENKIPAGVDDAAYIKAAFLNDIIQGKVSCDAIDGVKATVLLGTMLGGFNVAPLVEALSSSDKAVAESAAAQLKNTLLVYNSFNDVKSLMDGGNALAKEVIESWANAEWFFNKPAMQKEITLTVYKIPGETNTDDLSPASEAFTRADIPVHANSFLVNRMENPLETMKELKTKGHPLVYVGDVVGTGSSRKSGVNSLQWHMGEDIPYIPGKRTGGVVIGDIIAPIFFNTAEDSGCIPIQAPVGELNTGDVIVLKPFDGVIERDGKVVSEFTIEPNTLPDEMRAGGRVPLIIGKGLTAKAREALGMDAGDIFIKPAVPADNGKGFTLAQKMVGKACGLEGVKPGVYCEPVCTTVGSQDTTGAMTRDEVKDLAAVSFGADFVLQSFCHTSAYPKPADIILQHTLPQFMTERKGFTLRPGDGVIHSWLNRMCLPDTVGTGGDSHTRFPIGISFPAGSGLVAFAAVTGSMPLTMPESVLVRFSGEMQPGITLRDMVNAIPYQAIKDGLLTVEKKGKKNIFAGRILEIEGLEQLKCEQAFELSDASAERSAAACTVKLDKEPIIEYLESNIALIEELIAQGYEDRATLERRAQKMRDWVANPVLLSPDADAEYAAVIEINMSEIKEPIVACPNDPDDVKTLSEVHAAGLRTDIDEVFVGSCMTNIGLFRANAEVLRGEGSVETRLWICPPTKMDEKTLTEEGYYSVFGMAGARIEPPGCSLCMGNQASVKQNAWVFSTSTRNFDNRLGKGSQVYLGSAELAAVVALNGKIPTAEEYLKVVQNKIKPEMSDDIYKYLNFNKVSKAELEAMVE
ncbi:MAG TPA: bifunctional aconitate hydratase 2/2-methylisocitrate dehydratase [Sulfurovum sp.]|jgi:aconitate hydratase 2/2-methylisocitrate dehydratase|nr:MAG: bifunctional aconitate hydratase 2/2-methylisocitrate dehydratase [Sulfurovum sp. 35-42-20]OYZ23932.1 MAG: bifunctional aconitate hydratase 2/2-methylisocitrate dehydratase [Sulfurovum sp. 16-42-52]OYZ48240.1 MAG: bifunctional aconitate hydratase 2/2-methylisocitrate dehydratase [Sulfurovum sp. 24-42-9]OZA43890.1 MAG: bifunctional aconitate hydratase 2/2-methylisocitrate dehydratase [Sulfurovum sp. 17-42-90]OZA60842.1 MAG: bifunctional aconitate hydratase 2/2-methylisocitrate dehydratas